LILSPKGDDEEPAMLIRFSCLMLALVAFVPGAFTTFQQAALIVG
jgi:hypothetical protein